MTKYPLGLPKGSVRAILAILLVLGLIVYAIIYQSVLDVLAVLVSTAVGYYFGLRTPKL